MIRSSTLKTIILYNRPLLQTASLVYYNASMLHAGSAVIAFAFLIAMSGVTFVLEAIFVFLSENFVSQYFSIVMKKKVYFYTDS